MTFRMSNGTLAVGGHQIVHDRIRRTGPGTESGGGGIHQVVGRDEAQEPLDQRDGTGVVLGHKMDIAAHGGVGGRAADLLHRHRLAGGGLDDLGAADEHVRVLAGHDQEVGQGRAVGGPAGARPGDDRNLRNDARGQDVAEEHLAVAGKRIVALLDPGAARVVDPDHRNPRP